MGFRRFLSWPRHLIVFLMVVILAAMAFTAYGFFWGIAGFFTAIFLLPFLLLYAVAILAYHLFQVARRRDSQTYRQAGTAVIFLCLAPIAFFTMVSLSNWMFTWATFVFEYNSYRRVITLAEQGRLPKPGKSIFLTAPDGTAFIAERNTSRRIAFMMPNGGFLNEWRGFLYDPAGVGKHPEARQKDGTFADLFDNYTKIEHCSRMTSRFYVCSFS